MDYLPFPSTKTANHNGNNYQTMSQAKDITDEVTAAIKYALIMQHATSVNFKEGGIMQNSERQEAILHKGESVINKHYLLKKYH